jgi:hypothetical protein
VCQFSRNPRPTSLTNCPHPLPKRVGEGGGSSPVLPPTPHPPAPSILWVNLLATSLLPTPPPPALFSLLPAVATSQPLLATVVLVFSGLFPYKRGCELVNREACVQYGPEWDCASPSGRQDCTTGRIYCEYTEQ